MEHTKEILNNQRLILERLNLVGILIFIATMGILINIWLK